MKGILQGKSWIYFKLNYIDTSPLTVFSIHLFDQPRCTFCKFDQIHRKLRIWSYLLKKSLMENFIFCAVTFASPDIVEFYFLLCQSYSHSASLPKKTSKFIILLFLEFSTMEINSFSLGFLVFDFLSIFLCLMLYYVLSLLSPRIYKSKKLSIISLKWFWIFQSNENKRRRIAPD